MPSTWTDAIEQLVGNYVSPNFSLTQASANSVRVAAGPGDDQVEMAIDGKPRWITADLVQAVPAGPAQTYNVWAVTADDVFASSTGTDPYEIDNTDHSFTLRVLAAGATPSGAGGEFWSRKIGEAVWDGAALTEVYPTLEGWTAAGAVGGDLGGALPNPRVAAINGRTSADIVFTDDGRLVDQRVPTDGSVTAAKVAAALKPSGGAAAGTEALRALGTTAATAAAGNDARLSDARAPTGAAGGDLAGSTFPNPLLRPRNDVWITSAEGVNRFHFAANGTTFLEGFGVRLRNHNNLDALIAQDDLSVDVPTGPMRVVGVQWPPPLVTTGSLAAGQGGIPNPIPDGFVVLLQVDSASGINWPLRYRSTSTSTFKWEPAGDPTPTYASLDTTENLGGLPANTWNTTPVFLIAPVAGEYMVRWGWYVNCPNVPSSTYIYVTPNVCPGEMGLFMPGVGTGTDGMTHNFLRERAVTLTAGQTVRVQTQWSNGSGSVAFKTLTLTPRRVG